MSSSSPLRPARYGGTLPKLGVNGFSSFMQITPYSHAIWCDFRIFRMFSQASHVFASFANGCLTGKMCETIHLAHPTITQRHPQQPCPHQAIGAPRRAHVAGASPPLTLEAQGTADVNLSAAIDGTNTDTSTGIDECEAIERGACLVGSLEGPLTTLDLGCCGGNSNRPAGLNATPAALY